MWLTIIVVIGVGVGVGVDTGVVHQGRDNSSCSKKHILHRIAIRRVCLYTVALMPCPGSNAKPASGRELMPPPMSPAPPLFAGSDPSLL